MPCGCHPSVIKTIGYKDYDIEIMYDEDPVSPREFQGNLGVFHCWHKGFNLGDKNYNFYKNHKDYDDSKLKSILRDAKRNNDLIYPLYIYEHSGVVLSLSPFSCPWDSGQVGYIIVNRQKVIKEYGKKILTKQIKERVFEQVEGEIKVYNQYLDGDVYGYNIIDKEDKDVDSCWGYYGQEECVNGAKLIIDNF